MIAARKVRIHSGVRDLERFPQDDEKLVAQLMDKVCGARSRGLPRPAVLVLMEERVIQYDLPSLIQPENSLQSPILAAVAGQEGVECMALVGTLRMRQGRGIEGLRTLTVFVEWPDSRWSMCWQVLNARRELIGNEPVLRSAVEGWPRPNGLGGWFSRARRDRLRLRIRGDETQSLVH